MEWIKSILENAKDEPIEEIVESIKKEFPKHAVPKDEYNKKADKVKELEVELDNTKDQLENTSEKISNLQELAKENEELSNKLKQVNEETEERLQQMEEEKKRIKKKLQLEKKLMASEANKDAIDLLVNDFDMEGLALTDDGLAGFDEQLEKIKEKRPGLFATKEVKGDEPKDGETTEPNSWQAKYDKAIKQGNRKEAIKIKQKAFNDGYIIN